MFVLRHTYLVIALCLSLSLSRIETPSAQHLCCSPAFAFVTRSDPFVHAQVLDCWTAGLDLAIFLHSMLSNPGAYCSIVTSCCMSCLQIEFSGMIKYSARQTMMEAMKQ